MIHTIFDCGTLTIFLSGRVDTAHAAGIDHDIETAMAALPAVPDAVVVDCADLSFISSTGLRIVLKYKRLFDDFRVVNVCREVYNVFEITGFTRIMTVERALRRIDLSLCSLLAQGGNGAVYRINDEEIVKVQLLADKEQMLLDEIQRSKAAFILGVPTAISFDIVDCGDGRHGAVYEALNSDTLGRYVDAHPEELKTCAVKYADLLMCIHHTDAAGSDFVSIKDRYLQQYDHADEFYSEEEIAVLRSLIEMIPDSRTLVHGDAHTNNILTGGDGELMFIDMADTDMGHPIFDYSGIALSMLLTMQSGRCKDISGLSKEMVPQFLSIAFAHMLNLTESEDVKQIVPRLLSLAFLKQSMTLCIDKPSINKVRPILLDMLRKHLFADVNKIRENIQWFVEACRK